MGNSVMKDEADLLEELSCNPNLRLNIPTVTSRTSSIFGSTEFPSQVEDAISVTDSTTASVTEYDSANDYDVASNRLSSCTDSSCDFPINTQNVGQPEVTKSNQVSSSSVNSTDYFEANPVDDGFLTTNLHQTRAALSNELTRTIDDDEDSFISLNSEDGFEVNFPLNENPFTRRACFKHFRRSKRNKLLLPLRRRKKLISKVGKPSKSAFRKLPIPYKDLLILHYKENRLAEGIRLTEVTSEIRKPVDINVIVKFCLSDIERILLWRSLHSAYFRFDHENVVLRSTCAPYRLEKSLVQRFFANKSIYATRLDEIEFLLSNYEHDLRFVLHMENKTEFFKNVNNEKSSKCGNENKNQTCVPTLCQMRKRRSLVQQLHTECKTATDHHQIDDIDTNMNGSENISEAGPTTAANIDNLHNIPFLNDSTDLDYISKVGGTGLVSENLRKQSLYVKFDPLVANESNTSLNGDVTLSANDLANLSLNDHDNTLRVNLNDSKINSSLEVTDGKSNEYEPIGKLISVTPNKSPRKKKTKEIERTESVQGVATPQSSPRFADTDSEDLTELKSLLMKQMKREEAFKDEIENLRRENEHNLLKIQNAEKEIINLRNVVEASQENEKKLKNELAERIKSKQQLSFVMEEYEKTISQMVSRKEDEKAEFEILLKKVEAERDSAMQHLNNLENAFNDVHQKYERGKIVNEALKKNEDILKKSLSEYEVTVKTVENKYELLKSHATSQLDKANQELELITQTYEKEQAKLKAMLRKSEIQINSFKNALDQKVKENQELTAVCDELIVKLSNHSNA